MGCPQSRGQVQPDDSLETKQELLSSPVSPPLASAKSPELARQRSVTFLPSSSSSEKEPEEPEPEPEPPPPPVPYNRRRRSSVSGESMSSNNLTAGGEKRVIIPKSEETRTRLHNSVKNNLLFRTLTEEAMSEVLDAMFEEEVEPDHVLIKQGDLDGEFFYVVGEGMFDIFVNGNKVITVKAGGSFGELALLYNAPRAATVVSTVRSVVYGLDRITFKRTLMNNSNRRRELYLSFLKGIPLLGNLEENEMNKVADALVPIKFKQGDCIIRQGDPGEIFYILEQGKLSVKQHRPKQDEEVELGVLTDGAYFGEIALLNDAPRVASIIATQDCKCVMLDRAAFTRLLGPCADLLRRNITQYDTIDQALEKKRMREAKDRTSARRFSSSGNIRDVHPQPPTPRVEDAARAANALPPLS